MSKRRRNAFRWLLLIMAVSSISVSASDKPRKLKVDEILAKHLEAIGAPEARANTRSRFTSGTLDSAKSREVGFSSMAKLTKI